MTKSDVEYIFKRYCFISDALRRGQNTAVFYVGNRRQSIDITEEVRQVVRIIDDVYLHEHKWNRMIIRGIKMGYSDKMLISLLPWSKNAFYERKHRITEKIYGCCISMRLVAYQDILGEEI